jgi:histidinol phosphatase-like PHP family hydrolase
MHNLPFDCHVHSSRSACAEDINDAWLFERAQNSGICFAVTDHSMHMYYEPEIAWAMYREDALELFAARRDSGRQRILDYVATFRACPSPNLRVGLELDVLPDNQLMFEAALRPELDLLIGALHLLPTIPAQASEAEILAEFRLKTATLLDYGVEVLAHPFRILLATAKLAVPADLLAWVVQAAGAHGTALEINSHFPFPEEDLQMIRLCREHGVKLAVGTDSHRQADFGVFDYHRDLFAQAGLTEEELDALLYVPDCCPASVV